MLKQQIIAMGGGGFSMEASPFLDDYILSSAGGNPRICFLATASGDSEEYITRFYRRFTQTNCQPTHLELFRRDKRDLEAFLLSQDIIYVGGGNTANMLAIWAVHGVDRILKKALESGVVLCGISAGSICWFEEGVTDSFGQALAPYSCLGFLSGSNCPHYDGEAERKPIYHRLVSEGLISPGVAADDSVALHYVDGELYHVVSSKAGAAAYRIEEYKGEVVETHIPTLYLGE
ncbi:Type 1 glutamine amidotransferase-like domain-containing protein [Endozoicomonas numazuensis]|uniref:Peptidase n=1 Tax=Endozoicomonas numazuensis TaxID=1137799 RepID=A0A081NFS5_9GAMM|nr:peptidase E [Endozoicomonas numazuensis]KEQ17298.1 peptidase [Endozoicomonas numazuensis]